MNPTELFVTSVFYQKINNISKGNVVRAIE